jgi:hypothetical protein
VAPAQLVQEFADVIAMVFDQPLPLDHLGDALGGPQLRAVTVRHRTAQQQLHQPLLLGAAEPWRSSWRRFGFESSATTLFPSTAPAQHAAGMAPDTPGNLMQRKLLPEKSDHAAAALFQQLRRSMRSHRAILLSDGPSVLHYLCGSQ